MRNKLFSLLLSAVAAVNAQSQVLAGSPSPTSAPPFSSPSGPASGSSIPPASGSGTAVLSTSSLVTVDVSLLSTNPTAVPLASLTSAESSAPTTPLYTTFAAGATPSGIAGAPPLPDISQINPANYPALDKVPPTDTQQVQQWIAEVNSSGISIPNIPPTVLGGCPANPGPAANATSSGTCWWTCGHCSRPTDVITCADKLTWGSSFDDGPGYYTPNLLAYLNQNDIQTTFFVVGSRAISWPHTLQTEYMTGNQICVHTWSHPYLTTLTTEEIIAEFGWTKQVIRDVTGVTPIFFRPPYGDIDDRVRAIARAMDLIPIIWTSNPSWDYTFDTNDFNIPGGLVSSSQVVQNFEYILGNVTTINTGFIVLEHDLFEQTVNLAIGYIIPEALAFTPKLTLKPVVECLNQQLSDAYLETNNNNSNPLPDTPSGATGVATLSSGASSPTSGASNQNGGAQSHSSQGWTGLLAGLAAGVAFAF